MKASNAERREPWPASLPEDWREILATFERVSKTGKRDFKEERRDNLFNLILKRK